MEEGQRRGLPPAGAVAPAAALLLGNRLDDRTGGWENPVPRAAPSTIPIV